MQAGQVAGDAQPDAGAAHSFGGGILQPREWLKKAALVNGVYLLNNPFTFSTADEFFQTHTLVWQSYQIEDSHSPVFSHLSI